MLPLLIDLDGVLRIDGKPASGAKEFTAWIHHRNVKACILSNSTRLPPSAIVSFFEANNTSLSGIQVHTALLAAHDYVKERFKSISVFCDDLSKGVFDDIVQNDTPEAVVVGDLGKGWDYDAMNRIFNMAMGGAEIIAMQMNKFQKEEGKLTLDAGPFIAAIEYATGKKATLIGKPSKIFFATALKKSGFNENADFIMLGDDLEADIQAAQNAGGKGMLLLTGKTTTAMLAASPIKPDFLAANLTEAMEMLSTLAPNFKL